MHIAILTFEGFNELDSLIAFGILNGVSMESQVSLRDANEADAVIVGSGILTRDIVKDRALMAEMQFDPSRQLLGAQCSGTLVLAKLGLLNGLPACTDLITKPWVEEAGVNVLDQPFFARDNVATAGGCLASQYLAAWIIARLVGIEAAQSALHYVAPVGEKDEFVSRGMRNISPYLPKKVSLTEIA
jgi:transcriptional regulator GlxA family with amidase domain